MTSAETPIDYGTDSDPAPTLNILAQIDFLANAALDAEAAIGAAEEALAKAKARRDDIAKNQLPEVMAQAKSLKHTTESRAVVEIKDQVKASLTKAGAPAGFKWLRDNKHGAIIKTELSTEFEAGRDVSAVGIQQILCLLSRSAPLRLLLFKGLEEMGAFTPEIEAALAFLIAVSNNPEDRFVLGSTVHASTLGALVRRLLAEGKATKDVLAVLGAHTWKEASVTRKS